MQLAVTTVVVELGMLRKVVLSGTYQEAVEAGLKAPTYEDECDGTIVAEGSREDNQPMESIYPLGVYIYILKS